MITLKNKLYEKAKKEHGAISPCGGKTSIHDCFTYEKTLEKLFFWFNCEKDKSTRVLTLSAKGIK